MNGSTIAHFGLARQFQNLKDELLAASNDVLSSGIYLNGPKTVEFENWLASKCKTKYATTCHSGTQALEILARFKLETHKKLIKDTPTVRIPNLTYPATFNSFALAGWNIKIADTDSNGILVSETQYGIYDCVVGFAGRTPYFTENYISHIEEKAFGIIVDGAQHWLVADGQVGSGMAISFDPTKNLPSSGNGGAIVTNNKKLFEYANNFKNNGKPNSFSTIGTNSKLSEQDCAHLLVRTKYLDDWQIRRKKIADFYISEFKNLPLRCLNDTKDPHCHQKFIIYTPHRNELYKHLSEYGIETKFSYDYTISDLDLANNCKKIDFLSTSHMLSKGLLALPIYPELTDTEILFIINKTNEFFRK